MRASRGIQGSNGYPDADDGAHLLFRVGAGADDEQPVQQVHRDAVRAPAWGAMLSCASVASPLDISGTCLAPHQHIWFRLKGVCG